jgi:hypothetical protein
MGFNSAFKGLTRHKDDYSVNFYQFLISRTYGIFLIHCELHNVVPILQVEKCKSCNLRYVIFLHSPVMSSQFLTSPSTFSYTIIISTSISVCRWLKKNDLPAGQRRSLSLPGYSWLPWPSGRHHSYREDTNYHTAHISVPGTCSTVTERTVYWILHHSNKKVGDWPLCGITLPYSRHQNVSQLLCIVLQQQVRPSLSLSLSLIVSLEPILTWTNLISTTVQ